MTETTEATTTVRLGQRLRQARLARNLTQSEVAASQFSVSYISAVERGQIRPSLGALEKLAQRLQVSVAELGAD
jgi:transcriptional regulator with XRE-family HTH domain